MGLAQTDAADEDHVDLLFDEGEAEQVLDLGAVDLLGPGPVELFEGLEHREAGELDAPSDAALLAPVRLAFDQSAEEVDVGPLLGGGLLRESSKCWRT